MNTNVKTLKKAGGALGAATIAFVLLTQSAMALPLMTMASGGENSSWEQDWPGFWLTKDETGHAGYRNNECSYIETPIVPGAVILNNDPYFRASGWINTERYFDAGYFLFSRDGGQTWNHMPTGWENHYGSVSASAYNCIASATGDYDPYSYRAFSGLSYPQMKVSLPYYGIEATDLVKVRFMFGTDGSVQGNGIALYDMTLGGIAFE